MNNKKGYTLFEILVTLGLIFLTALILLPFSIKQVNDAKVKSEAESIASAISTYSIYSDSGKNNKNYGFKFEESSYYILSGDNFTLAESYDIINLSKELKIININFDGSDEFVFLKNSFRPEKSGSFQLTSGNITYQININDEGFIEYYKI